MSRHLIKQLQNLKYGEINPREEWVSSNRAILLSQIKNTLPIFNITPNHKKTYFSGVNHVFQTLLSFKMVRPLIIVLIGLFVIPTVWIARGFAQGDSLPGDTFYPAKRVVEKTQVALVSLVGNRNKEVQLHLEFAQRRAHEVQKVVEDPSRKIQVNETVSSLKSELNIVSQKLTDFKDKPESLSNTLAVNVQKQTGEIKQTLQEVKQTLQISSSSLDQNLTKEVALAKDLTKEVDLNNLNAIINSHLKGGVSKDDVKRLVDITLITAVTDVVSSQQDVEGVKTVIDTVKMELNKEFASTTKKGYNINSTSTKELTKKISDVVGVAVETSQAASTTKAVSVDIDKKITEAKNLLSNGDLTAIVGKVKEVNEATKEAEIISEITLQKVQTVLPLVQVIKVKTGDSGVVSINSSTLFLLTNSSSVTSSLDSTLTTTTFNFVSNTIRIIPVTTGIPVSTSSANLIK